MSTIDAKSQRNFGVYARKSHRLIISMTLLALVLGNIGLLLVGSRSGRASSSQISTVFVIVMENHNWSEIQGSAEAPYINHTLLPMASYAQQYYNPPGNHPSEPNYLWLEAGTNFGVRDDNAPRANAQTSPQHLTTLLDHANISWKAYQEGIDGTTCPLANTGEYVTQHNPMIFFDDVTNSNDPHSAYCIAHERPFSEMAQDLQTQKVAQYNFITPNLCDDMHDACAPTNNAVRQGDNWLAQQVPTILSSQAYKNGGALFITWDEGEGGDGPIGMIALSSQAKGNGYANSIHYTHSSLLRTVEEIFGVTPLLGDAAQAPDLADLFQPAAFSSIPLDPFCSTSTSPPSGTSGLPAGANVSTIATAYWGDNANSWSTMITSIKQHQLQGAILIAGYSQSALAGSNHLASFIAQAHDTQTGPAIKIIGYVPTSSHNVSSIDSQIDAWYRASGNQMDGIFLDESTVLSSAETASNFSVYQQVNQHIKQEQGAGTLAVLNIGSPLAWPLNDALQVGDIFIVNESTSNNYQIHSPLTPPASHYGVIVENFSGNFDSFIQTAMQDNISYIYLTDTIQRYDLIPGYWNQELDALMRANGATGSTPGGVIGSTAATLAGGTTFIETMLTGGDTPQATSSAPATSDSPTAGPTSAATEPAAQVTATPTSVPTATPTPTPTAVPTSTPEPTAQATPTATSVPTATPTVTPTATVQATPTSVPTATPTPKPTPTPTKAETPSGGSSTDQPETEPADQVTATPVPTSQICVTETPTSPVATSTVTETPTTVSQPTATPPNSDTGSKSDNGNVKQYHVVHLAKGGTFLSYLDENGQPHMMQCHGSGGGRI